MNALSQNQSWLREQRRRVVKFVDLQQQVTVDHNTRTDAGTCKSRLSSSQLVEHLHLLAIQHESSEDSFCNTGQCRAVQASNFSPEELCESPPTSPPPLRLASKAPSYAKLAFTL